MTIAIAKISADGNKVYFKATHPVVETIGRSLLTGWLGDWLADENLLDFKIFVIL